MNRLAAEFQRLYAPTLDAAPSGSSGPALIGADGRSRALVLELGRPTDWERMSAIWRGVQTELALPAPAIVIGGRDSYQLWFSLREAVTVDEATRFLDGLRRRWLTGLAVPRVRQWPAKVDGAPTHADRVPAQVAEDQWSAFVAPDLAPVFVEAPWLDIPPGAEGQADLLKGLASVTPREWAEALALLGDAPVADREPVGAKAEAASSAADGTITQSTTFTDPRAFLLQVMNDGAVPLALRIEAAKALLPRS